MAGIRGQPRHRAVPGDEGFEIGAASAVIASASEAIHGATSKEEWIASSLTLLAMTLRDARHTFAFPRRISPGSCQILPPKEGVGNAGRPVHPQPRVRKWWLECTRVFTASSPENARHPHAMVYGLYRALPGDRALLPPSSLRSLLPKNLAPASGCQDHTALPSASRAVRQERIRVHRIPARVRDDRETPLSSGGTAISIHLILVSENPNIFADGAGQVLLICPSGCFVAARLQDCACAGGEAGRGEAAADLRPHPSAPQATIKSQAVFRPTALRASR